MRKTLKPEAVPSIFKWSKPTEPRREITRHELPQKKRKMEELTTSSMPNISENLEDIEQLSLDVR